MMKADRCSWTRCRTPVSVYNATPLGSVGYCAVHDAERLDIMERVARLPKFCRRCGTEHSILVSCKGAAR